MRSRQDGASRWVWLGIGLTAGAAAAPCAEPAAPAGTGTVVVRLADGTSLPLQGWTLSYEYVSWKKGASLATGQTARREAAELWIGKRSLPVAGTVVDIQYQDTERVRDDRGVALKEKVSIARGLTVQFPSGEKTSLRLEPPARELLGPADKDALVSARSLDLRGQTLGGTNRDFCLLSFSVMVECGVEAENRVVGLDFTAGP